MKTFIFNGVSHKTLDSLGVAFANNFCLALEAIKSKKFLKTIKSCKKQEKRKLLDILYTTHYVQNVLSILIYEMTNDHILLVGGKTYKTFEEVIPNIKEDSFRLFLADKGISRTIISTVEDEKLKLDIKALENYSKDEFGYKFFSEYYEYDEIENFDTYINNLTNSSEEKFKSAVQLFENEKFLMYLAHSYSLNDILEIRSQVCPVFHGLIMLQDKLSIEIVKCIFNGAYYWQALTYLKSYKFKGVQAKKLYNKLKKLKKNAKKKYFNYSYKGIIKFDEELFKNFMYLIDLSKKGKIKVKKSQESYELTIPYCHSYVCTMYVEAHPITISEDDFEYESNFPLQYDLWKIKKSIDQHKHYAIISIIFSILIGAYYGVAQFTNLLDKPFSEELGLFDYIFIGAIALVLLNGIFILFIRQLSKKRYKKLCNLKYYRNNQNLLVKKELEKKEVLELKEAKLVKRANRFYRIYCGLSNFFSSVAISLVALALVKNYQDTLSLTFKMDVEKFFVNGDFYYVFIPAAIIFILGFIRKKKTSFSYLFTFILSIAATVGLLFVLK